VKCTNERERKRRKANPEKYREYQKKYRAAHPKKRKKKSKWTPSPEQTKSYNRRAREKNLMLYGRTSHPRYAYQAYKKNAVKAGRCFMITLSQFTRWIQQPCWYCKKTPAGGIDRIKNDLGYTTENSVPCCSMCNQMKHCFSRNSFLAQCERIMKNHKEYIHNE
jgi:hypothetical protein